MAKFEAGKIIKTRTGSPIKIEDFLGEGGQGEVYLVTYNGEKKALKWYKNAGKDPDAFYKNLERNIKSGSPDKAFLWPEEVTEKTEGSFGYIMNLRPEGYHELSEFIIAKKARFSSFKAATEACIRVVSAFRILHNNGYSYQDLNDGNFFIDPQTGDVLICDNDNVAENGTNSGIIGKPRYMAPEVVLGKCMPNSSTDRFSLAIVLFIILMLNHPLEGKHWKDIPCMTTEAAEKLYGSKALFVFDKENQSNAPVPGLHNNALRRWKYMPAYIRDAFQKALGQDAIKNPAKRMRELDWLKVLVRFRSEIALCSCSNEVFIVDAKTTPCDGCGKPMPVTHTIKLAEYSMAAINGSRVYRCQIDRACNADKALDPIASIISKKGAPGVLGIKNMTDQTFAITMPDGSSKRLAPKEVMPFLSGTVVKIYNHTFTLC